MIHYTGKMKPWHKRYIFSDKKEYRKIVNVLGLEKRGVYSLLDITYIIARKIIHFLKLRYFLERMGWVIYADSE